MPRLKVQPGKSFPLGATVTPEGVNFSVFSKNCNSVDLLLFDEGKYDQPAQVIPFDPVRNKTFYYWHMLIPGMKADRSTPTACMDRSSRRSASASTAPRC